MTGVLHRTRQSLPPGALALACHAAVPVAVDPGFLHLLRINFFLDPPSALPYETEAALLTSPLFRELGDNLYEVDPALRDRLLAALTAAFGPERPVRVAMLLEQYTNRADPWPLRELEYAQRLTALSIVDPDRAAAWLAEATAAADSADPLNREWYVAMRTRLGHRPPSLDDQIAAAVSGGESAALLELLQLPGVTPEAAETIAGVLSHDDGPEAPPIDGRTSLPHLFGVAVLTGSELRRIRTGLRRALHLVTPIGRRRSGSVTQLTLDPAELWHGAIVGPPGSGRHAMAWTIVTGLAIRYPPEVVAFAFVDSRPVGPPEFSDLPHTAAVIRRPYGDTLGVLRAEMDRRLQFDWSGPFLVVVVNDYEALIADDPAARDVLDDVAVSGGAAGMALLMVARETGAFGQGRLGERLSFGIEMSKPSRDQAVLLSLEPSRTVTLETFVPARLGSYREIITELAGQDEPARRFGPSIGPEDDDVSLFHLLGLGGGGPEDLALLRRSRPGRLTAPIGVADDGRVMSLDLRDSAEPNGLIIGTAPSEESELLRTIVLSLALTHTPDEVTFALVSPVRGVTYSDFDGLPHLVARVTPGEARDPDVVRRLIDILIAELVRRADQARRRDDTGPALVIIIEDYDELLTLRPDVVDVLARIVREGRAIGVRLLLAGTRFEEGPLRGLASGFGLRIGLRTTSEAESLAVLGVPDAAHLPARRGMALLSGPGGSVTRVRVARVGHDGASFAVDKLAATYPPAMRLTRLARLEAGSTTLGGVLGVAGPTGTRGYQLADNRLWQSPALPVTVSPEAAAPDDRVRWVAVDRSVAVTGPPGSGKTAALESLICGIATTRTPAEAQIVLVAPHDPGILRFAGLPHVGVAVGRPDVVLLYRAFAQVRAVLSGAVTPSGATYVVVDGLHHLPGRYPELIPLLAEILKAGPRRRVHLLAAGFEPDEPFRTLAFPQYVRLTPDHRGGTALLPTLAPDDTTPGDDSDAIVRRSAQSWAGAVPEPPRLPARTIRHPAQAGPDGLRFTIGVDLLAPDLTPVAIDFRRVPGLVVSGERHSGKRSFLRALATMIDRGVPAAEGIVLVAGSGDRWGLDPAVRVTDIGRSARALEDIAGLLTARLPGPEIPGGKLRDRSWWQGPEVFVLADNQRPLDPLTELLPYARDIGLHVIAAETEPVGRNTMGSPAGRLRDMRCPELLLSGAMSPDAGIQGWPLPPGVGHLVARDGTMTAVQLAYLPPAER